MAKERKTHPQKREMTEKEKTRNKIIGETALDLGKLTFGGAVLAGLLETNIHRLFVVVIGLLIFLILVTYGLHMLTKNKKEG